MGVHRAKALGPVGIVVGFQWSESQALHQVRWCLAPHCEAEALSGYAVIAAADAGTRPLDAHLLVQGTGEESTTFTESRPGLLVRHSMPGDDEETDMLASVFHRSDHPGSRGRIAESKRRDVDDRHHGGGVSRAFATRREIVSRLV